MLQAWPALLVLEPELEPLVREVLGWAQTLAPPLINDVGCHFTSLSPFYIYKIEPAAFPLLRAKERASQGQERKVKHLLGAGGVKCKGVSKHSAVKRNDTGILLLEYYWNINFERC